MSIRSASALSLAVLLVGAAAARAQPAARQAGASACLDGGPQPLLVQVRGTTAEFCLEKDAGGQAGEGLRCYAVDLPTGRLSARGAPVPLPPADQRPVVRAAAGAPRLEVGEGSVEVCPPGGAACKVVAAGKEVDPGLGLSAELDETGQRIVLSYLESRTRVEVFEVATARLLGSFAGRAPELSCIFARFVGDRLLVSERECGGEAKQVWLTTLTGKRIAVLGGAKRIGAVADPVRVSGDVWAFTSERGDAVVLQDVVTGKVKKRLALGSAREPGSVVAAADGAALAVVYGEARLGELAFVDLARAKVTRHQLPRCASTR